MRVFRLVLTVALAAAVFAQDATAPEPEGIAPVSAPDTVDVQGAIDAISQANTGDMAGAIKTGVAESGVETPQIPDEFKDAAGNVIGKLANSEIAKENGVRA